MRDDFAAFILTHGRPKRVLTYDTLKRSGYTGKIYVVIDDEDDTAETYRQMYGDEVIVFSKNEIAATFDEGDNFNDRRAIVYARNACWGIAKKLGITHFIQLDDDYDSFRYRIDGDRQYASVYIRTIDHLFTLMCEYLDATPFAAIAMSQGGDHIGGGTGQLKTIKTKRKAMNTFVCSTAKPFAFAGRLNEDVNIYTSQQRAGLPFLSLMQVMVNQMQTQYHAGGMSDIYEAGGTYVKSFYSVMYAPSCVKVAVMGTSHKRLHHRVAWNNTAPKIIRETYQKPNATTST